MGGLGEAGPFGGGRVTVDVAALAANYARIAERAAPARAGAVVKADAYGLGAIRIAPALAAAGCRDFFVAFLQEALTIQPVLPPDARLYILNGLAPAEEAACAAHGVRPVLNSTAQAQRWRDTARALQRPLPAALQVDTGMSRLGLAAGELPALLADPDFRAFVSISLLMTHLACADVAEAPANRRQLEGFRSLAAGFPLRPPVSIANSAGVGLERDFHGDLVRPGIALYGVATSPDLSTHLQAVVRLEARVIQVRSVARGEGVGYGLDYIAPHESRIATLAVGYADGWPRRLGGRAAAYFRGVRLPLVGRVSMDSLTVDATAMAPGALGEGDHVELIGPLARLEVVAQQAGTAPYEILTGLGPRLARVYAGERQTRGENRA